MQWHTLTPKTINKTDQLLKQLLKNRSIADIDEFLNVPHPKKIKPAQIGIKPQELKKAAVRIQQAVKEQEKVIIYGDYDADGITAASIVWLTLKNLGLEAEPFIPDRIKHGYGLSLTALKEILADDESAKPDLIITVDNGVTAQDELAWLKKQSIDVIVTDHHQLAEKKLPVLALIHSTEICGAAVVWLLMRELAEDFAMTLIDFVAIATIADQVPLQAQNRSFVKHGLELLKQNKKVGLSVLNKVAAVDANNINAGTIGFQIAPRINAAGRMAHGITAARLLCTKNFTAALSLAAKLEELNQDRRSLTKEQLEIASAQAAAQTKNKLIIAVSDQFHEGVIGLLAGRLTEKFHKPSIVIAVKGDTAKASARSVKGVNITNLIRKVESDLLSVGGHKLAAGFSLKKKKLPLVKSKLLKIAQQSIDEQLLQPSLTIDALVSQSVLAKETIKLIEQFKPFGIGNPKPVLGLKNCIVCDAVTMGKDDEHLKLVLRTNKDDYHTFKAVGWNMGAIAALLPPQQQVDAAFNIELNKWNGKESIQLKLKDINFKADDKA